MQLSKGFQITLGVLLAVAICAGLYFGGKYAYDWYQVERAPTVTDTQNHLYTRTDSMTHGERCFNCGWLQKEDTSVFQSRDFKDDTGYDIVEFWCCPSCKKMNVTNDFLDKVEGDIESGLKRLETAEEDVSEDEETTTTADRYQHYKSVEIDQNCPYCGYRNVGKFKVYKDTDNFDEDTFKCIDCGRYYYAVEAIPNKKSDEIPTKDIRQAEDGNWYVYSGNEIDTSYSGKCKNQYGTWNAENGQIKF